jgi:tRNA1Val (adenine37-N6)-methyltransferase
MITPFLVWEYLKINIMANPWFRFKQFTIRQDRTAFKVGTDGVLLGAWTDVSGVDSVLDIGTGTGLLALMMAQRTRAGITAIEIDRSSCEQAVENARESPWSERIEVVHASLQDFAPKRKFDLIISNPPFFRGSMKPGDHGRRISRHHSLLTLEDLVYGVERLIDPRGRFCLVLPVNESLEIEELCAGAGLKLHRRMRIRPIPSIDVKRHLLEFRPYPADKVREDELVVEKGSRHDYTPEYRELTGDFYLAY